MAILQCKMCGGAVEFHPGETTGVCSACACLQTLPSFGDERKVNLYNALNHYRRIGEFEKASHICEQIFSDYPAEAEPYWRSALCRYGICYLKESDTEYVPTFSLLQTAPFERDPAVLSALEYADETQRAVYESQIKAIAGVQTALLAAAAAEETSDVFIGFCASDADGFKTADSVIADYLCKQFTRQGLRVFLSFGNFSSQLAKKGESKVYAALHSAKVMIILGTQADFFDETQPKNEWRRFLELAHGDANKHLFVAAIDVKPNDLPDALRPLPIFQLAEKGTIHALVDTVCQITANKQADADISDTVAFAACVKMFLQTENWKSADLYCDKILAQDPKNANAYLGKLLAQLQVHKKEELAYADLAFDNSYFYRSALWFADDALAQELQTYVKAKENHQLATLYQKALAKMQSASSEQEFNTAASLFEYISEYEDAEDLAKQCREKAENCRKDDIYHFAKAKMKSNSGHNYEIAIREFETIRGWKDVNALLVECHTRQKQAEEQMEQEIHAARKQLAEQKRLEEKKAARNRKIIIATLTASVITFFSVVFFLSNVLPERQYQTALSDIGSGNYIAGYEALVGLENYKDSPQRAKEVFEQYKVQKLQAAKIGDTVYFGTYEQDNNEEDGKEDIEWLVLDKKDDQLLLITYRAIDHQPYHAAAADITWQNCSLRKWLNKSFINTAFTQEQQEQILETQLQPDQNPEYDTIYGKATTDKIFLLSASEAKQYFASDAKRVCLPTRYAIAQGAVTAKSDKVDDPACWWFLRTPGGEQSFVAFVHFNGDIRYLGGGAHSIISATRPAMWITIK